MVSWFDESATGTVVFASPNQSPTYNNGLQAPNW